MVPRRARRTCPPALRAAAVILALVAGAGLSRARAQDVPPKAPPEEPKPAEPEAPILPPEELDRVRSQLARIEEERRRLTTTSAELEQRARELERRALLGPTSPVLAPRKTVQVVTVRDSVARALVNNADLLVSALVADASQEDVEIQQAPFDPTLSFSGQFQQTNSPNLSNNSFSGLPVGLSNFKREDWTFSTQLSKRFVTGTTLTAEYDDAHDRNNNLFAVNPTFQPKLRGTLTQNLLKGFFGNPLEVNTALLNAAENDAAAADALYTQQLMDAALQVEQSYWDVVRAEENLKVSESSLKSATELLNDRKKRKELGAGTGLEVTIAEAGVAQGRESMIVSENDLETKRDILVKLCEPVDAKDRFDAFLVPVDRAELVPTPDEDVAQALATALARRPDYRRSQLQVESARKQHVYAENQALPQLDLFAFIEEDGAGETSRASWSALGSGNFYAAGGGIKLALPLFLRAERAQARQAKTNLDRASAAVRALESEILLEVRQAIRNIRTARARIDATKTARMLSEKQVAAVRAEVRFGVSLPRQVLDAQRDLDQARSREIQALIDFRVALSTLEKVKGTILEPYLDKLPPRVRRFYAVR